jgi:L-alanine-DL-glutamate epimerase-like enolase superfamily enzyme
MPCTPNLSLSSPFSQLTYILVSSHRNTECDYSSAYVALFTSDPNLTGYGMTFTIGRGNDIVCSAIHQLAQRLVGKELEELFANMGKAWEYLNADPQLRWIGPEKGVVHIALGAVDNALWDLFARSRKKPLWKLVVDFTPVSLSGSIGVSGCKMLSGILGALGRDGESCGLEVYLGCDYERGGDCDVEGERRR